MVSFGLAFNPIRKGGFPFVGSTLRQLFLFTPVLMLMEVHPNWCKVEFAYAQYCLMRSETDAFGCFLKYGTPYNGMCAFLFPSSKSERGFLV